MVAFLAGDADEPGARQLFAVLLLDEITSALDPELVGEVLNVVRELAADGLTMLLVTHEMSFARDVSARVVFMDAGRVAVQGTPREVFGGQPHDRLRSFLSVLRCATSGLSDWFSARLVGDGGSSSGSVERIGDGLQEDHSMDYFAGLEMSIDENRVCVLDPGPS